MKLKINVNGKHTEKPYVQGKIIVGDKIVEISGEVEVEPFNRETKIKKVEPKEKS
jgi:hypothetical protein